MSKNPFDVNPFENIKTPEDFQKAMETFTKQLDEACSELDDVEKELNNALSLLSVMSNACDKYAA